MIKLYLCPGSRTWKAITEAIPGDLLPKVEVIQAFKDTKPSRAHMILVAGTAAPTKEIEKFAARLQAYPVCIPEASEWLREQIRKRLEAGLPLVMVDAALASTSQLSGAK